MRNLQIITPEKIFGGVFLTVIISGESSAAEYFGDDGFAAGDVIAAHEIRLLQAPESVLIVGKGEVLPKEISVFAAIVDADGGFSAEELNGTSVISCGMSGRNTVSMTSCTNEYVSLSLNRSIMTLAGICEPFEQPVRRLPDTSDYDCMAAFAAAILLGIAGR
jgi:hypothetical protein